jgi:hypothetical protein
MHLLCTQGTWIRLNRGAAVRFEGQQTCWVESKPELAAASCEAPPSGEFLGECESVDDGRVPETYELQFELNSAGGYNVHGSNSYELEGEVYPQEVTGVVQPATGASSWKTPEGVPMQFWLVKPSKKRKAAPPAKPPSSAQASQRSSSSASSSKRASAAAAKKQSAANKAAGRTAAGIEAAPLAPVFPVAAAAAAANAAAPTAAVQQQHGRVAAAPNGAAADTTSDTTAAAVPTAVHLADEQAVVAAAAVKPEAVEEVVDLTAADTTAHTTADTAAATTNETNAEQPAVALTADEQQQQIDAIVQREAQHLHIMQAIQACPVDTATKNEWVKRWSTAPH